LPLRKGRPPLEPQEIEGKAGEKSSLGGGLWLEKRSMRIVSKSINDGDRSKGEFQTAAPWIFAGRTKGNKMRGPGKKKWKFQSVLQ